MKPFQKWLLWVSSLLTTLTGIAFWWMKNVLEPVEPWAVINHPLQPWLLKAHIVAAPVLVFAVGLITAEHVWKHFRAGVGAGRRSGLLAMAVFVPMVLTGYLVQAVTHAGWLTVIVWVHLGTGLLYAFGLSLHARAFRKVRNGRRADDGAVGSGAGGSPETLFARGRYAARRGHRRRPSRVPARSGPTEAILPGDADTDVPTGRRI